jgi:hypothetical protein
MASYYFSLYTSYRPLATTYLATLATHYSQLLVYAADYTSLPISNDYDDLGLSFPVGYPEVQQGH